MVSTFITFWASHYTPFTEHLSHLGISLYSVHRTLCHQIHSRNRYWILYAHTLTGNWLWSHLGKLRIRTWELLTTMTDIRTPFYHSELIDEKVYNLYWIYHMWHDQGKESHVKHFQFEKLFLCHICNIWLFPPWTCHICDMIKRNESNVGDVVFEILAKSVQIPVFQIVFSIVKSFITL